MNGPEQRAIPLANHLSAWRGARQPRNQSSEPPAEELRQTNVTIYAVAIDLVVERLEELEASSSCAPPAPRQSAKPCLDTVVNPVPADAPLVQVLWVLSFMLAWLIIWVLVMRRTRLPPE